MQINRRLFTLGLATLGATACARPLPGTRSASPPTGLPADLRPVADEYLARVHYGLGNYGDALNAINRALIAAEIIAQEFEGSTRLQTDPLRLIEAVTSGVAFLAAGSIILSGGNVLGLTTGAGMWLAGAIGLACGIGALALAVLATVIVVPVLWALRGVSHRIENTHRDPAEPERDRQA